MTTKNSKKRKSAGAAKKAPKRSTAKREIVLRLRKDATQRLSIGEMRDLVTLLSGKKDEQLFDIEDLANIFEMIAKVVENDLHEVPLAMFPKAAEMVVEALAEVMSEEEEKN